MKKYIRDLVRNAVVDHFMPYVILWRYMTAPEEVETISIKRP